MSKTVTVSIGRNIGEGPMADDKWESFIADVEWSLVYTFGAVPVSIYQGESWYGDMSEWSAVLSVFGVEADERALADLRERLEVNAFDYGQEAIALQVTEPIFVERPHIPVEG